jgi:hydroxylamine dehydrogenase
MKRVALLLTALVAGFGFAQNEPTISEETETCLMCHESATPGIVADWRTSRHARTTFAQSLKKDALERRTTAEAPPDGVAGDVVVGCYECHALNADAHADNFAHFDFNINVIVTPNDCAGCHPTEAEEYSHSKKGNAHDNLMKNPLYMLLVNSISSVKSYDGAIARTPSGDIRGETCLACHGTVVEVAGTETVESDFGDFEAPVLTNWPNHGVGRINPDGSKGACSACHPRHSFSIEIARKPYTCGQCHLDPDVPAFPVYKESKHGNIFSSKGDDWNYSNVPWVVGEDFTAPTCATCHHSTIVSPDGEVIAERSHDFGTKIWTRLFSLVYSHPHPKDGRTHLIRNADGQPLPTTFDMRPASDYLIDEETQQARRDNMRDLCASCHSSRYAENHFAKLDRAIEQADSTVLATTKLMTAIWGAGVEDGDNPFDETLELTWVRQWLFYANSVKYASAMGGPDYATFKNGWYELTHTLEKMKTALESATE